MVSPARLRAALVLFCAGLCGSARATVPTDDVEPPAPTLVVLAPGDPLLALPGTPARPGDYRLEYGTLSFVVSQPESAGPRPRPGGALIDVVQLFPTAHRLGLRQLMTKLGAAWGRQPIYVKAATQRSPDLATITLEGYDSDDPTIEVRTQFQAGAGLNSGEALRIVTAVRNTGTRRVPTYRLGDLIEWGAARRFVPGAGLAPPSPGSAPFLLGLGPDGAGSLLYTAGAALPGGPPLSGEHGPGWSAPGAAPVALAPGQSASFSRLLAVAGDASRLVCGGRTPLGGPLPVRGQLKEEGGGALGHAVVVLEEEGGPALLATRSADDGRFTLCAPRPAAYRLRVVAPGTGTLFRLPFSGGVPPEQVLLLPRPARLRVSLREVPPGRGGPRPAPGRVTITGIGADLAALLSRGPGLISASPAPAAEAGAATTLLSEQGELDVLLPAGRYRVAASHGPFLDTADQEVTLRAGEARRLTLTLRRGVPLSEQQGVRCALLGVLPPGSAAALGRADGLDVVLGAGSGAYEGGLAEVSSAELRSSRAGRFTVYPLNASSLLPDARLLPGTAAAIDALRHVSGEAGAPPVIQLAPADREPMLPVDAREIWSGAPSAGVPAGAALRAWLTAVAAGIPVAGVAGLDPWGDPLAGDLPRTCFAPVQINRALTPGEALRVAVRRGDLVMTNGPWLRVQANGAGPGELAAALDGKVEVSITALAASRVGIDILEVWAGPQRAAQLPVAPGTQPLRFQGKTVVRVDRDTPIVVLARGAHPLDPALGLLGEGDGRALPLAITAPVFVDRDGDGRFTSAGLSLPAPRRQR